MNLIVTRLSSYRAVVILPLSVLSCVASNHHLCLVIVLIRADSRWRRTFNLRLPSVIDIRVDQILFKLASLRGCIAKCSFLLLLHGSLLVFCLLVVLVVHLLLLS